MLDDSVVTAVTGADSGVGAGESTPAAPTPGGEGVELGGTAAPPPVEAQESATPNLDEIIDGIPADDTDLGQHRDVEALRNQREQLRVLSRAIKDLRPLETLKDYQPLVERGTPDIIQQRLDRYDSLITPVVDPQTQQPVVDEQGFQAFTTLPFIESMQAEQKGFAEQLLLDVLSLEQPFNGQKGQMWQRLLKETFGLDPNRLQDYQNIDALTAQVSGQALSEQLTQIPEQYHELFKSLPPKVREDFLAHDEEVRNWELQDRLQAFNDKQQQVAQQQQQAAAQQRYQAELRAGIEREQEQDIEQQFSEGLSSIKDDIASKVTFSSDPKQDALMKEVVAGILLPLRDPANHAHMKSLLELLGVQLDAAFTESLSAFSEARRNWKALDLSQRKAQADQALGKASGPRARVMTKAGQIGLAIAQALGGQMKAKAESRNGQLQEASQIRPTVNGQAPANSTNLVEMARAAGVNLNDGKAVNAFIMSQLAQPARQ